MLLILCNTPFVLLASESPYEITATVLVRVDASFCMIMMTPNPNLKRLQDTNTRMPTNPWTR
ncbi:hypothetical protein BDR03DRAFT_956323 [Suillus americanus]|nr:hypothetical protein BDR03DRAFT_956323 [Suillus americanus]